MIDAKRAIKQLKALEAGGKELRLAAEWREPWKSLISTILSARTRDDKTIEVSNVLYKKYNNLTKLSNADIEGVQLIIKPVNFYKTKAKNIINCAKKIVSDYGGRVPREFDKLVELPGVGRKTANVFLAESGGAAIGVDTHVGYISKRIGWTHSDKPAKVEEDLKKLFPKRMWGSINYVLVRFGQTYRSKTKKNKILDEIKKIN